MNGHPARQKRLAAIAAAHDDWSEAHASRARFDPVRARKKPGSDYNQHHLDVTPPPGAEEDFHRRVEAALAPGRQRAAGMAATWDGVSRVLDMSTRVIDLVGPRGYIHGWIFVGIPGAGQKVTLGSGKHRTGVVERADATHLHVRMADGSVTAIPHHGDGKGQLAKVPAAVPQYSSTRAGRDKLNKALIAAGGAAPGKAGTAQGKRAQTELLARAVASHPQLASDEVLNDHVAGMRASLGERDAPSFSAHRDAVEARIRQHGMMPAGDPGAAGKGAPGAAPKTKRAAGNAKQLTLIGERVNGPDKTSGLMKAGDMQEGYQAIGQAPNGIVPGKGNSDPWWMAGPGGAFALSVRQKDSSGDKRVLVPWDSGKQQEAEAGALKATTQRGDYFSGGSRYQQALAKTAASRAAHEAAAARPRPAAHAGSPEAAAARQAAGSVRFEPGLTRGQKDEAEQRLLKAARHLDAGNHGEAAAELDATVHATSLRGGAVVKGSTAAKARDLRDKVRGKSTSTPGLTADSLNVTGANGGKRAQRAALAQASLADLKAIDAENAHRAAVLGKPGQVSATHQLVKDEIASRTTGGKTVNAAYSWDDLAAVVELSAKTAALEVTPAPRGKPGGGLYDVKGLQHTPYFQNVVKALIEKRGMPPGKAYAIAYGALRKWSKGGGKVSPEVSAAATGALAGEKAAGATAKAAHGHAGSWDDVLRVLDFGFNPMEARVGAGSATAGQFSAGGGGQPAAGQQPAKGKQPPAQTAAQKAHAAHVAHVAHVNGVSTQKAELLVTAQDDRQKAAGLIKQRDALTAALQSAAGKVSSGQAGSTTSSNATTKTTAPATTASSAAPAASTTAASTSAASTSTAAKSTTAASAAAPAAGNTAAIKAQIAQLNTQISQLLAQANQAATQAAAMK